MCQRGTSLSQISTDSGERDPIVQLMWGGRFDHIFCQCQKEPDTFIPFLKCVSASIFLFLPGANPFPLVTKHSFSNLRAQCDFFFPLLQIHTGKLLLSCGIRMQRHLRSPVGVSASSWLLTPVILAPRHADGLRALASDGTLAAN